MRRPTLRRRLVVGIVALLTAVTLVIGVVSTVLLRGFLLGRLDGQLQSAIERSERAFAGQGGDFLAIAGQAPGTIGAVLQDDTLYAPPQLLTESGAPTALTTAQAAQMAGVAADRQPVTLDLGGDLAGYRLAAVALPGSAVLIIGLPMREVDATVWQLAALIAVVGAGGVLVAAGAGALAVRRSLRPLERLAETATSVAGLPLDRDVSLAVRVRPADADGVSEVGRVGSAFNRMLEHVAAALAAREASERRVRTFVADASHELRTPLASIRGYAELTRRGGHDLPPDVTHALDRVESESVRMTRLVEDLLLLARLDEGREPDAAEVDLGRLLVDAVGDAAAAGPEHGWELDVPSEPVVVSASADRIRQVLANLLANARVHTPAGTTVTGALHVADGRAVVEVADTGPGIPDALLPTVFERFVRGDGSRSRAAGSTGLGLAIVHAVVTAHGGTVGVESVPGATVFRIALPLAGRPLTD